MKKFVTILAAVAVCMFALVGCNKYNSVLYSHADDWFTDDFLRENRVSGAFYPNDNYVEGESEWSDKYIRLENLPSSKTVIFTQSEEFEKVFTNKDVIVDFERQMVVLYFLSDVYPARDYYLDKIDLDGQTLKVYYELEYDEGKDATMPYQRCFMLKLDKCDFTAVEFIETD